MPFEVFRGGGLSVISRLEALSRIEERGGVSFANITAADIRAFLTDMGEAALPADDAECGRLLLARVRDAPAEAFWIMRESGDGQIEKQARGGFSDGEFYPFAQICSKAEAERAMNFCVELADNGRP